MYVHAPNPAKTPQPELYTQYRQVAINSALATTYLPLETREFGRHPKVKSITVIDQDDAVAREIEIGLAIEHGRAVARDIGGSDPERTAAPRIAEYIAALFANTNISVKIETDLAVLEKSYPLLAGMYIVDEEMCCHH